MADECRLPVLTHAFPTVCAFSLKETFHPLKLYQVIHTHKLVIHNSRIQKKVSKRLILFALMHCYANVFLNTNISEKKLSQFPKSAPIFTLMSNYADENVQDKVVQ